MPTFLSLHNKYLLTILCVLAIFSTHAQAWYPVGKLDLHTNSFSMTLDKTGTPYVAYNGDSGLTVIKYNGYDWICVGTPGFSRGVNVSIAVNRIGTPYVTFDNGNLYNNIAVMKYAGSSWVNVGDPGFSPGIGMVSAMHIALDNNDTPYVAFVDDFGPETGPVFVMKYIDGFWHEVGNTEPVDTEFNASIAINNKGIPYIRFQGTYGALSVMKSDGTNLTYVGSEGFTHASSSSSLAMAPDGSPYIVFTSDSMRVMKYNGSNWMAVGKPPASWGTSWYSNIAIDYEGTPYVAYSDVDDSTKVTVMKYNGSNWITVGGAGFSNAQEVPSSIVIDNYGTPYVAYSDTGNKVSIMRYGWPEGVKNIPNPVAISICPNPSHGTFAFSISSTQNENTIINITNLLGEKVKELVTTTNTTTQIQLNNTPGIYFISATTKNGTSTSKIMLQ